MTTQRENALDSARSLYACAATLLTVVVLAAGAGVVIGASRALDHHGPTRTHSIEFAVTAGLVGLFAIMPFMAAQTFARFVEYKVSLTADPKTEP